MVPKKVLRIIQEAFRTEAFMHNAAYELHRDQREKGEKAGCKSSAEKAAEHATWAAMAEVSSLAVDRILEIDERLWEAEVDRREQVKEARRKAEGLGPDFEVHSDT